MASEASVQNQSTTDGIEEKEVVHEEPKQTEESGVVEKPTLEESVSSTTTVEADSKEPTEDDEHKAHAGSKKEDGEVDEGPAPGVVAEEDNEDDTPPVDEVNKGNEEAKASGSQVTVNYEDEPSAAKEAVKVAAKTEGTSSSPCEPEIEAPVKEPGEDSIAASPVEEPAPAGQEPQVPKPVEEATGEPLDIPAEDQPVGSETTPTPEEQPILPAVAETCSSDASEEPEKKYGPPEAGEVVVEKQVAITETATAGSELSSKESGVKEIGSSTLQDLATVPGDPAELNDAKAPEVLVKPELDVAQHEEEEKSAVTERVVEEVKTLETGPVEVEVEGQVEEKAVAIEPTLGDKREAGDQSGGPSAEASAEREKPSEDVEAHKGVGGWAGSTEKMAEEPKDENVKDDVVASVAQTSRGVDLEGKGSEAGDEPIAGPEKSDVVTTSTDKDETVEKREAADKAVPQDVGETSEGGGAGSKTDAEVHRSETPAKPKTSLMSKVKHSIGKVKKAIVGKSPSSKTMSAEPKDDQLKSK